MENIKEISNNSLKIKLRNKTNQEKAINELKDSLNLEKLQISIKNCQDGVDLLNKISSHFIHLQNLKELSYNINNLLNLDICFIFKDLNKLPNLNNLSIRLMKNISYQPNPDNLNLGKCISSLTQLKSLKLDFWLYYSSNFQESFYMLEAYQNLKNLKSLEIILREEPKKYPMLNQLIEGISNLQGLEELALELRNSMYGNFGFNQLIEEIFYLSNLKILSLKLQTSYNFKADANRFSEVIKNLKNLEKVILKLPKKISHQENFIKELKSLENLKILNYKSQNLDCQTVQQQIKLIADLKHLEKTNLSINMSQKSFEKEQLWIIKNDLLNFSNLSSLKLSFPPNNLILISDLMSFLYFIQTCKNLEKLEFIFQITHLEQFFQPDSEPNQLLSQGSLKELKITIDQMRNKSDQGRLNKLLLMFKDQLQLEKFNLYIVKTYSNKNFGKLDIGDVVSCMDNLNTLSFKIADQFQIDHDQVIKIFCELKKKNKLEKLGFQIPNEFENIFFQQISESLNYLQNLQELKIQISENSSDFDEQGIYQFCQSFSNLQQLKTLDLGLRKMKKNFGVIFPLLQQIQVLKRLKYLLILYNSTSYSDLDQEIQPLPDIFFPQDISIIDICLKQNQISFKNIKGIFEGVQNLVNLSKFSLSVNLKQLEFQEIKYIETKIANLSTLQNLKLDLQQSNLIYLLNSMKQFYQLEQFTCLDSFTKGKYYYSFASRQIFETNHNDFNYSNSSQIDRLQDETHGYNICYDYFQQLTQIDQDIFTEIFPHYKITSFKIDYNSENIFSDQEAMYLFPSLSLLVNLKKLKLQFTDNPLFSSKTFSLIAQSLSSLKNLEKFELYISKHDNHFDFIDLKPIFLQLSLMLSLKRLALRLNNFQANEEVLQIMFNSISKLQNLKKLKMFMFNNFQIENNLYFMRESFQDLSQLIEIFIQINLTGLSELKIKSYLKSFQLLKKINTISINLPSLQQKTIILKIPKLVCFSETSIEN